MLNNERKNKAPNNEIIILGLSHFQTLKKTHKIFQ